MLEFLCQCYNFTAHRYKLAGGFFQFIKQCHRFFLGKMALEFPYNLVVIHSDPAELGVQVGEFGVVFGKGIIYFNDLEFPPRTHGL